MPVKEAAKRLKKGDITFILEAEPEKMYEMIRIHPSAPFYAGVLMKAREEPPKLRTVSLFESALSSPSKRIQEAASLELIDFMREDTNLAEPVLEIISQIEKNTGQPALAALKAAALYFTGQYNEAREIAPGEELWDRAVYLLSSAKLEGAVSQELFQFLLSEKVEDVHKWAYRELERETAPPLIGEPEKWAVEGHFETAARSYWDALGTFRNIITRNQTLFFKNPALLVDLGRCFQYTGAAAEGVKLFLEWDKQIQERVHTKKEREDTASARYNLLFFAGRIERQQSRWKEAADYFVRSLVFAPDKIQEDACIWYILNVTLKQDPEKVIPLLRIYARQWHDNSYFSDILGEVCQTVTAKHDWTKILEIFGIIRNGGEKYADGATMAKYAYIIARAVSEGYVPPAAAAAYTGLDGSAGAFFRIAFDEPEASFYYRALSARYLGEHVIIEETEKSENGKESGKKKKKPPIEKIEKKEKKENAEDMYPHAADMDFLLGFFEYGASRHVIPHLWRYAETLSISESRTLAQALSLDGQYYEAIRFIGSYMKKDGFSLKLSDMALFYPRPFYAIINKYSAQTKVGEAVLFGLIRTESAFRADAVSSAGAVGLAQVMGFTAEEMADRIRREGGADYFKTGLDLKDPEVNVHIGAYYLAYLIERADSPLFALIGYNGGPNRIKRFRAAEPLLPDDLFLETINITETREYGKRVSAAAAAYDYLYNDVKMEAVFADILKNRR
jgi:soluble lytic murein transglycosylase